MSTSNYTCCDYSCPHFKDDLENPGKYLCRHPKNEEFQINQSGELIRGDDCLVEIIQDVKKLKK
jgi:hypothetical protein